PTRPRPRSSPASSGSRTEMNGRGAPPPSRTSPRKRKRGGAGKARARSGTPRPRGERTPQDAGADGRGTGRPDQAAAIFSQALSGSSPLSALAREAAPLRAIRSERVKNSPRSGGAADAVVR